VSGELAALSAIKDLLGRKGYMVDPRTMAPFLVDWRQRYSGEASLVALPRSSKEVAGVVRICSEANIPIVPQGGNTGHVGGGVPGPEGGVVINLSHMNRILNIDAAAMTIEVEAGAVLQTVQEAARGAGRMFPLSLGAEGSCQIGGNISTNAGGIHVLRFGNMRHLVLGLETVLPSGEQWNGLSPLAKDNAGYDLKHLFIGAEGTLGIITRASLRLFPAVKAETSLIFALADLEAVMSLLGAVRETFGERLVAFETLPRIAVDLVLKHIPDTRDPFSESHPWYALVELWDLEDPDSQSLQARATDGAAGMLEGGLASDAIAAQSGTQEAALWKLRESVAEAEKAEGAGFKHDVSVPLDRLAELVERGSEEVEKILPGARPIPFGHAGDGNLHFNFASPKGMSEDDFLAHQGAISGLVHDLVNGMGGSIAAEHGIGRAKRDELRRLKGDTHLKMLRAVKTALDPKGLMNPGVLI
jgi:FAD/FMN-containing dehydrogenase